MNQPPRGLGLHKRASGVVVRRFTVYIHPDVATHVLVRAASQGVKASELVETAIRRVYMRPPRTPRRKKTSP